VCARVLSLTAIAYPRIKPSKHALKAPSHTGCDFRVDITRHQLVWDSAAQERSAGRGVRPWVTHGTATPSTPRRDTPAVWTSNLEFSGGRLVRVATGNGTPGEPRSMLVASGRETPLPHGPNDLQCRKASCSITTNLMSTVGECPRRRRRVELDGAGSGEDAVLDDRAPAGLHRRPDIARSTKRAGRTRHLALLKSRGIYVGLAAVEVVGMKKGLVQQPLDVLIGGRVVHEGTFPAAFHQTSEPELGEMLTDRRGSDVGELGQACDRRLALQQCPQHLDPGRVREHAKRLRRQVDLLLARHVEIAQRRMHGVSIPAW
jgi:hypothetical protein